ncbi:MAG TPA: hypothetical protein VGK67_09770, partial [Myxococcales bacterium]
MARRSRVALLACLALASCQEMSAEEPAASPVGSLQQPVADSSSEDVVGQAPWRVQGSDTVIPFDVSITDAGRAGTLFHHLRLGQVTI